MIQRWLEERREGVEQSEDAIAEFVQGVVAGDVTRAAVKRLIDHDVANADARNAVKAAMQGGT